MKMFYLTRTSLYLMITLVLCFALHIPVTISLAEPPTPQKEKPQYVIRVGTMAPAGVSYMKYTEKGNRDIEALTDHRVKFELYAGGVLGDEPDMVKMVQEGKLEVALVTSFSLEEVAPETLVLSLPFLFQDEFELDFILEKYEPLFAQYAHERGIEILGIFPVGCSPIFSTVPISGFDEIKDKKVMMLENSTFFTRPFGADGIPLSFSEVESALNSGKVEVVFGPPAAIVVLGWYPYIRYIVMECIAPVIVTFIVNLDEFQKLPEKARSIIKKFIREKRKKSLKRIWRDNEIAMLGLMKRGVKIIRFPPEEMERQREATKAFWDSGVGKWYPRELLDNILRDLEAYRAGQNTMENKN